MTGAEGDKREPQEGGSWGSGSGLVAVCMEGTVEEGELFALSRDPLAQEDLPLRPQQGPQDVRASRKEEN